jgi:tetratricopeptide (TPR) repeat protein
MNIAHCRIAAAIVFFCLCGPAVADELSDGIAGLGHGWAKANYDIPDSQKEPAFADLQARAHQLSGKYAGRAEPLVWEAIITSTHAKYQGMFAAGKSATAARDLLLSAEKINPDVLDGSIFVSLGSLYYKVPRWPLSFGDKDKARAFLLRALKINPTGIDPNFFYGEFLMESGDHDGAVEYLKRAMAAPPRPGREDADAGRRSETQALLKKLEN